MKRRPTFTCMLCLLLPGFIIQACNQQAPSPKDTRKMTQKVFFVKIRKDGNKLKEYLDYHQHIWPEVEAGFRKAGFNSIHLYRYEYLLTMIVEIPEGADLDAMGKVAEGYDEKCAAWNRLMATYQEGVEGTKPGQTWVEALPIYSFTNQ